jgi:predicted CopG family antitoxin
MKKRGRKSILGKGAVIIRVRVSKEQYKELKKEAKHKKCSLSEVVRKRLFEGR